MLHQLAKKIYPRACETRFSSSHPIVRANRPKFFKAAGLNFVYLLILFFCLFCYLFGSLFQQSTRIHQLKILWVDYDGGIIGDAVRDAYKSLQSAGFPTLIEHSKSEFPSASDMFGAVCRTDYWAAIYTSPQASDFLGQAIAGSTTSQYNRSNILTFIWNQARFPTAMDGAIASNLQTLSNTARVAYLARNGTAALATLPPNNTAALLALTNPWKLASVNIQPTTQGSRAIYNTLVIVLVLIQDFFYLAFVNGLYLQFKIYTRIPAPRVILVRDVLSGVFTMLGALLVSASLWAFKAEWHVSGSQFALNWLIMWLFAHVNFLTLDIFTIWLPHQFVPMALITWVVLNVTSILLPFDLSSDFFRWGYAMPAHAAYEALTDNWSRGCNPSLHYALPVLFAYEVSGLIWTGLGVYRRCHYAVIADEAAEEALRMRVDMALQLEHKHDRRLQRQETEKGGAVQKDAAEGYTGTEEIMKETEPESPADEEADRRQAEEAIEKINSQIEKVETKASRTAQFGPSFRLVGAEREL